MLLASNTVYIVAAGAIVILFIAFFAIFKRKKVEDTKIELKGDLCVDVVDKYMYRRELEFFYYLREILPSNFIAFPKVGVDNIIRPTGSKIAYNAIMSKYVDFVIFEESTMKPLLVIDLYDNTFGDENLGEQEPNVTKILKEVKLPLLSVLIKTVNDKELIKKQIFDIIMPKKEKEEEK